jgi:hypothetical protein
VSVANAFDVERIVRGWWEYHRRARGSQEERKGPELGEPAEVQVAHDIVEQVMDEGTSSALDLLAALVDAAPHAEAVVAVGEGPLQNLVHDHGDELLLYIESTARRSPVFRRGLEQRVA